MVSKRIRNNVYCLCGRQHALENQRNHHVSQSQKGLLYMIQRLNLPSFTTSAPISSSAALICFLTKAGGTT